jgi:putative tryptophan/tyrosine transport system substrate-binding protein
MRRRDLLAAIIAVTAQPGRAQDPNRIYRIGYLGVNPTTTRLQVEVWNGFEQGLRENGLVLGQNVLLERRFSEGREERQPGFLAELLAWKADVIVVGSPTAAVAAKAHGTVPTVLAVIDPLGNGLVANLARPGGNITGVSSQAGDLVTKQYELLREAVPGLRRLAVLWNPNNVGAAIGWEHCAREATALGLVPISVPITGPADIEAALARIEAEGAQALDIQNAVMPHRVRILDFALQRRLPTLAHARTFADVGVLMTYGASQVDGFRRAAGYAAKLLKGASPADLPIHQPTTFELVINLQRAKAIGLDIPPTLLARADEVIE